MQCCVDISANSVSRCRHVSQYIKDEPLTALAIAAAAGFVLGGGVNRRIGLALITIVGRIALRDVASGLIVSLMTGSYDNMGSDGARHGSGGHDDGRTDLQKPG